ncbi:MAG TPA: Rieske (2Fe-2S) protein [Rubrobacter sp.]|nr:Rieske (2Fe-2S) protein [Rubrobacter sp.]
MEKISRDKFIRLGTALGVGAAGASLAACGGGAGSGGQGSNGGGNSGDHDGDHGGKAGGKGSQGGSSSGAIAAESEVTPGSAVTFQDSGTPAVLVHLDSGDFVAYSAVCTHQGCTVAYKKGQLVCPCHGSLFDPADGGAVITGPAQEPLPEIPVKVQGGEVTKA